MMITKLQLEIVARDMLLDIMLSDVKRGVSVFFSVDWDSYTENHKAEGVPTIRVTDSAVEFSAESVEAIKTGAVHGDNIFHVIETIKSAIASLEFHDIYGANYHTSDIKEAINQITIARDSFPETEMVVCKGSTGLFTINTQDEATGLVSTGYWEVIDEG